jgi:hypothetical protein
MTSSHAAPESFHRDCLHTSSSDPAYPCISLPTSHLCTRRSSASPKFTQSSSKASFPSDSSIHNSSALEERRAPATASGATAPTSSTSAGVIAPSSAARSGSETGSTRIPAGSGHQAEAPSHRHQFLHLLLGSVMSTVMAATPALVRWFVLIGDDPC